MRLTLRDRWPEEVTDEARFAAVTELMEGLGQLLAKTVVLTYQNGNEDAVFLEFQPEIGRITYHKPSWR